MDELEVRVLCRDVNCLACRPEDDDFCVGEVRRLPVVHGGALPGVYAIVWVVAPEEGEWDDWVNGYVG